MANNVVVSAVLTVISLIFAFLSIFQAEEKDLT